MPFSATKPVPPALRFLTGLARAHAPLPLLRALGLDPVVRRTPWALERADVVMIVLNAVAGDSRVLKTAETLTRAGLSVTLLGKSAARDCPDAVATRVNGLTTILFPEPHMFLRAARTRIPALNWDFVVSYMRSAMWHYVSTLQPRILHTHDMNTITLGAEFSRRLQAQGTPVKWVHDAHEYVAGHVFGDGTNSPEQGIEWRDMALRHEQKSIRQADALITVSPMLADNLQRDYGLSNRPAVVLNAPRRTGIPKTSAQGTIRSLLGLTPEIPLMVYSGGTTRLRGVHTAVSALAELPGVHLALQTESQGPYMNQLRDLAKQAGAGDRFHIVPYVPPEEVPAFLRDGTLAIHPMTVYGNSEVALPNKLFDYCMAGLPSVVSDCKTMAAFVTEWAIGEVFRAEDPRDFARAVRLVLENRSRYVQAIEEQPDLIAAHCWEAQEDILLNLYQCLNGSSGLKKAC